MLHRISDYYIIWDRETKRVVFMSEDFNDTARMAGLLVQSRDTLEILTPEGGEHLEIGMIARPLSVEEYDSEINNRGGRR